jgi:hypothetical protein
MVHNSMRGQSQSAAQHWLEQHDRDKQEGPAGLQGARKHAVLHDRVHVTDQRAHLKLALLRATGAADASARTSRAARAVRAARTLNVARPA